MPMDRLTANVEDVSEEESAEILNVIDELTDDDLIKEWYAMGLCEIQTPGGHSVKAYDMERTICDLLRKRKYTDVAVFNYAVREYMKRGDKRIAVLSRYAVSLHIEKKVHEVLGVLF